MDVRTSSEEPVAASCSGTGDGVDAVVTHAGADVDEYGPLVDLMEKQ